MTVKVGEEELPTIDELDSLPVRKKRPDESEALLDAVFEDGEDIYSDPS